MLRIECCEFEMLDSQIPTSGPGGRCDDLKYSPILPGLVIEILKFQLSEQINSITQIDVGDVQSPFFDSLILSWPGVAHRPRQSDSSESI
jgi:hypothetical protein